MATEYDKVKTQVKVKEQGEEEEVVRVKKTKVTKSQPKKYKKGLVERLVVGMLGPEGIPAIGRKLNEDIIIPAVKNIVVDAFTSGINMAIFGTDERRGRGPSQGYGGRPYSPPQKVNYANSYQSKPAAQQAPQPPVYASRNSVPEYVLETRGEAINALEGLRDQIADYGYASVSDYYDLIGVMSTYADESWGWTDLSQVKILATRGGYLIKFPAMEKM